MSIQSFGNAAVSLVSHPRSPRPAPIDAQDRLIVALGHDTLAEARALIETLTGVVSFYKIGIALQLAAGLPFVRELLAAGNRVFLDYKYHDVPATTETAVARVAELGVTFLTVHGNESVIHAAVRGRGPHPLKLLAVTVLTSLDAEDIQKMGFACSVEELVLSRARYALEAGCDGVIASGQEAAAIRALSPSRLLIVSPGIRLAGTPSQDQKRTVTPAEAVAAGADYLVVGRPITGASDPRAAAEAVLAEMQAAFDRQ